MFDFISIKKSYSILKITFGILTLFSCYTIHAQRFSLDFAGGYSYGIARQSAVSGNYSNTVDLETQTETYAPISFSSGWIGRLGITALLNDQLFLTAVGRYRTIGEKELVTYSDYYSNGSYNETEKQSLSLQNSNLEVQLGLGLRRNIGSRLNLSMSAGPSFGVYSSMQIFYKDEYYWNVPSGGNGSKQEQTTASKPYFQIGAYTDISLSTKISKRIEIFGNAAMRLQVFSPKSSEITSFKDNGVELIDMFSVNETQALYYSEISTYPNNGLPTEPYKARREWSPASSLEFVLGLRYSMGKEPKLATPSADKKGIYFSLIGGYGLGLGGETQFSSDVSNYRSNQYSYGSGLNFGLMAGYNFAKGISFELGTSYNKSIYEYQSHGFYYSHEKYKDEASMFRVQTGLKIEGSGKRLNPFVQGGLSLGIGSKITNRLEYLGSGSTYISEIEYTGGMSFGGYGGLGLSLKLSNSISLVGQATGFVQSWAPKHSKITKRDSNGVDQLPNYSVMQLETDYVNENTQTSNDPAPDPNKPDKEVKTSTPWSSVVFSFGIRISLGK